VFDGIEDGLRHIAQAAAQHGGVVARELARGQVTCTQQGFEFGEQCSQDLRRGLLLCSCAGGVCFLA
jgi:hypothetical protein